MKNIIESHFKKSSSLISKLKFNQKKIIQIVNLILDCNNNGNKILVAGNGGSSADADHFTGELVCTFDNRDRPGISAISLSNNSAAVTAWSNDFDYKTFFKRQVQSIGKKGDIIILLSTSGGIKKTKQSINLVHAADYAKKKGIKVISFSGKSGGVLKKISDLNIHLKSNNTAHIQEAQMSILHCICACLDTKLIKKQ